MTAKLRERPDDLSVLIDAAATALGIRAAYVEKDFWVTEVLRASTTRQPVLLPGGTTEPVSFVFKGGTSLSRVFGVIERFSEDVDLLAGFPDTAKVTARHKVLKQVDSEVTAHLALSASEVIVGSSTTGVKRYTTYRYPAQRSDSAMKEDGAS